MNKKFSTLVASLLLTSAFSVYSVDAKPMLATPTQVETRAVSADVEEAVEYTGSVTLAAPSGLEDKVLSGFTNNSALVNIGLTVNDGYLFGDGTDNNKFAFAGKTSAVTAANRPHFYWRLENGHLINNAGQTFSYMGNKDFFEVVPLSQGGVVTEFFVIGYRDNAGGLQYLYWDSSTSKWGHDDDLSNATVFASVETEYTDGIPAVTVNQETGDGFQMSIASAISDDAVIEDADKFAGLLTAVGTDGKPSSQAAADEYYMLCNAAGKWLVFNHNARYTSDGIAEEGQFELVDAVDPTNHYAYFNIRKADNGSDAVIVKVNGDNSTQQGSTYFRLYIAHTLNTFKLSIAKYINNTNADAEVEDWAVTSFARDLVVNPHYFLDGKFVTIDFVGDANGIDNDNKYKVGGTLALRYNETTDKDEADFVAKSGIYEKAPEAQWAVSYDGVALYFANRENPSITAKVDKFYYTETPNVYKIASNWGNLNTNELVKITFVENHDKNDGYAVFSANDLRNETYHLGQVRQTADGDVNVYWAENHGTHQIGATVEEANASRWNLSLVNKPVAKNASEIDSVLVISTLQDWNAEKNRIDSKKDTLVILPYAFQNRSNNEFVKFGDGNKLDYYICDKDNKTNEIVGIDTDNDDEANYYTRLAQRFALKMKADGTYNFIALRDQDTRTQYGINDGKSIAYVKILEDGVASEYVEDKVYQENSTDRGTWREMEAYAGDANALMFVTKVDAPEYRKLVTEAALDTIKLYRADNEAQVVYEKRNDDAIVNGKALSFLNIDNDQQFTEINPALYADTAYVNRGNNTRWQYLLGVNIEHKEGYYCPEHGFGETEPCQHAEWVSYNEGRYLINMIDTANVYGANVNIHNNPYINETEEGNVCAKLSFVDAIHVLTDNVDPTKADKLYVINGAESRDKYTVVDLSTADFNVAKFAFKYTDSMTSDEFKIQTQWKAYDPATYGTAAYNNNAANFSEEGYLRWVNGCIVVDKTYQKGDVFNMDENETRTPTANEAIEDAASAISVIATEGGVIVKGAEGKNVIVSTILGKVVANETVTSDNVTIAAPAGIVVVSVDGESFKVAVK